MNTFPRLFVVVLIFVANSISLATPSNHRETNGFPKMDHAKIEQDFAASKTVGAFVEKNRKNLSADDTIFVSMKLKNFMNVPLHFAPVHPGTGRFQVTIGKQFLNFEVGDFTDDGDLMMTVNQHQVLVRPEESLEAIAQAIATKLPKVAKLNFNTRHLMSLLMPSMAHAQFADFNGAESVSVVLADGSADLRNLWTCQALDVNSKLCKRDPENLPAHVREWGNHLNAIYKLCGKDYGELKNCLKSSSTLNPQSQRPLLPSGQ